MTNPRHDLHAQADSYWVEESIEPIAFCRTTALGLVRVGSSRNAVGGEPLTIQESWAKYLQWRADPDVFLLDEPTGIENVLDQFVRAGLVTSKNSTDAYLAAFAISAGLRLVSFDRDFERFPGLNVLRP